MAGMVVTPTSFYQSARGNVLRKAALQITVAAAAAQFLMPASAMAQLADPALTCETLPASVPASLALSISTRMEPAAGPLSTTKARAILGGAMSKLEQMRAVQATGHAVIETDAVAGLAFSAAECVQTGNNVPGYVTDTPAIFRSDAILGSQSVNVARTPFDSDWAASQIQPNKITIQRAVLKSGARGNGDKRQQLETVNRWINQNIAFGEDEVVYHRRDYWAPASETLRRGIGDCEDFAIVKMELLSALGFARQDMRLIIARDLVRNADHAVLVVKLDGGSVMLDNVTDRLLDGRLPNDYRPIMSFSQNAKWVHGYTVPQSPTERLAALPAAVVPASGKGHDVLTVTAELELPVISVAWLSAPLALPTLL